MNQNTYTAAADATTNERYGAARAQSKPYGTGPAFKSAWSGWAVLATAAILTVVVWYWAKFSIEADAATRPDVAPEVAVSGVAFEYFPDQYVNQARDREEPVPTF